MNVINPNSDNRTLETRLGLRLAGALTLRAERLPHDTNERLRFAREKALARAREVRVATAVEPAGVTAGGGLLLGAFAPWLQRVASGLPLLLLLGGLVMIEQWSTRERVLAAADLDTLLLADALPPSAYGDPGFAEYLRTEPQP